MTFSKPDIPTPFRHDIEGLRAIAILLIVGYHAKIPGFSGGFIGVDIFFVISGYLITGMLVQEARQKSSIDFLKFYSRRVKRILPVFTLVLLLTSVLSAVILAPLDQKTIANSALSAAAYLSNIYFIHISTSYLGNSAASNPLLHTWALSVEWQFYMLWPVFIALGLGGFKWQHRQFNSNRLLWWTIGIIAISFSLSLYLTYTRQPWAFFLSPTRAWEFAFGAIGILIPQGRAISLLLPLSKENKKHLLDANFNLRFAPFLGWLGLCGILLFVVAYNNSSAFFPGFVAFLPVISTVLLIRAGTASRNTGVAKVLNLRPLQEIGRLSYSWFLWHWPVLVLVSIVVPTISLIAKICLLIVSLLLAEASYRLLENPLRHSKIFAQRPVNILLVAVASIFICIGFAIYWRQLSNDWEVSPGQIRFVQARNDFSEISGCNANYYRTNLDVDKCTTGPNKALKTIVLFGDSHALQWSPALEGIVNKNESRLIVLSKNGCATVNVPFVYPLLGREYKECAIWRNNVLGKIQELKPSLVVVSTSYFYPFDNIKWQTGFDDIIKSLSISSQYVAIIRDTPRLRFDSPSYLARKAWSFIGTFQYPSIKSYNIMLPPPVEVYDIQRQIAQKYTNVFTVDMNKYVCTDYLCDLEREGMIIYKDSSHLTATFVRSLAPLLEQQLLPVLDK